jgi:hypothetical protein
MAVTLFGLSAPTHRNQEKLPAGKRLTLADRID